MGKDSQTYSTRRDISRILLIESYFLKASRQRESSIKKRRADRSARRLKTGKLSDQDLSTVFSMYTMVPTRAAMKRMAIRTPEPPPED